MLSLQSNMVSPYSLHQQQLAFLSQQQALLLAAAKSGTLRPALSGSTNQPAFPVPHSPNVTVLSQNWANVVHQTSGVTPQDGQRGFNFSQDRQVSLDSNSKLLIYQVIYYNLSFI